MAHPPLTAAIESVGLASLAKELGVTYQAIRKWEAAGRLPRTEWTGETDYASTISRLMNGQIRRDDLLTRFDQANRRPEPASVGGR